MNHSEPSTENERSDPETPRYRRRRFLSVGAAVGATALAGCTSGTEPSDGGGSAPSTDSDGTTADAGTFRLLISDQPVAIDDFDELNVSFDRARIFRAGEGDDDEEEGTEAGNATATETGTAAATRTATESEIEDDGERGFSVIDLEGATVDLTQVVGEKAISVFDGELPEGRYTKVELYAADVEGIVDGEVVDVKIPSGKLQIVKPFEVVAGEALTFVFDINVVKKGQQDAYNLLPVISESGVAGQDVDVEEVGNGTADSDAEETAEEETGTAETEGPADQAGSGNGEGSPDDATENP